MRYLLMICSDGIATPEKTEAMRAEIPRWLEETAQRGVRLGGHALADPSDSAVVRVQDGTVMVTDGPFAETMELAGFDVIDCADLDDATDIAAKHPVSWFHEIEVRPFAQIGASSSEPDGAPEAEAIELDAPAQPGMTRFLLVMHVDGIAATDAEEEAIVRDGEAWRSEHEESGALVYSHALAHADAATTVRVRNGQTLLSDGPFAESREFIAGFAILDVSGRDAAVAAAAAHPLAKYHPVEVRPFAAYPAGDEPLG